MDRNAIQALWLFGKAQGHTALHSHQQLVRRGLCTSLLEQDDCVESKNEGTSDGLENEAEKQKEKWQTSHCKSLCQLQFGLYPEQSNPMILFVC